MMNMLSNPLADLFVYVFTFCVCVCLAVHACLSCVQLSKWHLADAGGAQDQHRYFHNVMLAKHFKFHLQTVF